MSRTRFIADNPALDVPFATMMGSVALALVQ